MLAQVLLVAFSSLAAPPVEHPQEPCGFFEIARQLHELDYTELSPEMPYRITRNRYGRIGTGKAQDPRKWQLLSKDQKVMLELLDYGPLIDWGWLMKHGLTHNGSGWEYIGDALRSHGQRTMPGNWRGHANHIAGSYLINPDSYELGDYGLYAMTHDLQAEASFLWDMGMRRNNYLGHSMGGLEGDLGLQGYRMKDGELIHDDEYARMMGEVFENAFLFGNPNQFDYGITRVLNRIFGPEAMTAAIEWARLNTPMLVAPMGNPPGHEFSNLEHFVRGMLSFVATEGGTGLTNLTRVLAPETLVKGVDGTLELFDPLLSPLKPLMDVGLQAGARTLTMVGAPQALSKGLITAFGEERVSKAVKALMLASLQPNEPGLISKYMNMSDESINNLLSNSALSYLWQRDVLADFGQLAVNNMKSPWHLPRKVMVNGQEVIIPPSLQGSLREPKPIYVKNVFMIGGKHDSLVPGDTVVDYVRVHQEAGNNQVRAIHLLDENHMSMVFEKEMAELMAKRMLDVANNPDRVDEMFNGDWYAELRPSKVGVYPLVDSHGEVIRFAEDLPPKRRPSGRKKKRKK